MSSSRSARATRVDSSAYDVPYASACTRCRARHIRCRRSSSSASCVACIRSSSSCLYPFSHLNPSRIHSVVRNLRVHARHINELLLLLDLDYLPFQSNDDSTGSPVALSSSPAFSPLVATTSAEVSSLPSTSEAVNAPVTASDSSADASFASAASPFPLIDFDAANVDFPIDPQFFDFFGFPPSSGDSHFQGSASIDVPTARRWDIFSQNEKCPANHTPTKTRTAEQVR